MENVKYYSVLIGKNIGLKREELELLSKGAYFHDIGKLFIPKEILNKPQKLSIDEVKIMRKHVYISAEILKLYNCPTSIVDAVLLHHERVDGKGYPMQLHEEEIPLFARIIAIADSFDAMTSNRPYKMAISKNDALRELHNNAGKQFDEKIVNIFINSLERSYSKCQTQQKRQAITHH